MSQVSLGKVSTVKTELAQERGEVEIMYSGGDITDKCELGCGNGIWVMIHISEKHFRKTFHNLGSNLIRELMIIVRHVTTIENEMYINSPNNCPN